MLTVIKSINLINVAARNQKLNITISSNANVRKVLNILTDYNLIEYETVSAHIDKVTLKYKNQASALKSIRFMGGRNKNNVTHKYAIKELNNKKALYIVQTTKGLTSLENAVYMGEGGILLFRIKI